MIELDLKNLRAQIDPENKYVDFSLLRTSLTVEKMVGDLNIELSNPSKEGECRSVCPKCRKERSFSINVNTNRFNCFTKGCFLKGGGVIDFTAKLFETTAKEASHLLACAYGISPYSSEPVEKSQPVKNAVSASKEKPPALVQNNQPDQSGEAVSREEFDDLEKRFERLSFIVWSLLFENGEIEETDVLFDDQTDHEMKTFVSG